MTKRQYTVLTQEEQDDMLVETLKAQERDHFAHTVNVERYQAIIADPNTPPEFKSRVEHLLAETNSRIAEVEAIIDALDEQMPSGERVEASIERLDAREAAARGQ